MNFQHSLAAAALFSLSAMGACAELGITEAPTASTTTAAAVTLPTGAAVTSGTFSGLSDHTVLGTASIVGTQGAYQLVFAEDFDLDGAPDPIVGFGNDGEYDTTTKVGALTLEKGAQVYSLPADFDPATAGEVYVWCEKFSVPLGVASLN